MQILCIGDSNTWGYNPDNGLQHKNRWTKVLGDLLPEHEIIEEGMCGRTVVTVDSFEPAWCGIDALPGIIQAHNCVDIVILMLGTNELKAEFKHDAAYIAEGIGEFIKMLQNPDSWKRGKLPKLLVISPILLGDDILGKDGICTQFDEISLRESKQMAGAIENICKQYHVEFMDASQYVRASLTDAIHLDEEGHIQLGHAIYNKLNDLLR